MSVLGVASVVASGMSMSLLRADDADESHPALFPFVLPATVSQNVTDISSWLDRPAGNHGFVRAEGGQLVTDDGPIRFWATNLCFSACFPSREQAEQVAAQLARWGINCVRLHHMDARDIWGDSPNKLTIDPKQLDRLDYLIYQLKKHGIYTNINLHVSRSLGPDEGFVAQEQRPKYDKGLGNFEPRMIELQKKYARDLLTHVNPYLDRDYAHEPAIAFVEISNEDALFHIWSRGQLDELPEPYATTFRKMWNQWLQTKYTTTDQLRRAWNVIDEAVGKEMLRDGDFRKPIGDVWYLERDEKTKFTTSVRSDGPEGKAALHLEIEQLGVEPWRPQLMHRGISLVGGKPYTLQFWARSDQDREIRVNCMMSHEPWERLGLEREVKLSEKWRPYRFTFLARCDEPDARITFTSFEPGEYVLSSVSLRPGGVVGLESHVTLEDETVPVLKRRGDPAPREAQRDFVDFMWDTERDYWLGMYHFLKDELDVQALVSGTQLSYSPVHIQSQLDYLDAHAYWQHPVFPNRPWDPRDWYVRNRAMVNHPAGTLSSLAGRQVEGKPYTISEYNHPEPNQYGAEGFPMLAAMGALQQWDGLFFFTYAHRADFAPRRITSYFNIVGHPTKLVHMPVCAAFFLRGDVAPARETLTVPLDKKRERRVLHETADPWSLNAERLDLDSFAAIKHRVVLDTEDESGKASAAATDDGSPSVLVSDTGQIRWDVSDPKGGYFLVNTPRSKLFTGFVRGRTFSLGEVQLAIGSTRLDWATVSLVCLDGEAIDGPGRVLIVATGVVQNTGASLEELGDDRVTLRNRWGEEPVLCEGIPAELTLPVPASRVQCYALDPQGNRGKRIDVAGRGEQAVVRLSPQYKTVWYEVDIGR